MKNMVRNFVAATLFALSLAPSFAQAPAPVPALPDTERRTSYSISSSTCACAVNFALYGDSTDYQNWVDVWINGILVNYNDPVYGWKITSPTGQLSSIPRPVTDAVLTFNNAQTGTIQIVGARRPRRVSQFSENQGVAARDLNQALTDIVAQNRETWDKINDFTGRAIVGVPGDDFNPLPPASIRAGKYLGFDVNGLLTLYTSTGSGLPGVLSVSTTAGAGITLTGTCSSTSIFNCQISGLYGANPGNLYVSPTGSDSNSCLTALLPCLTISHTIAVAQTYDLRGAPITINLAAGVYTKGVIASGVLPGQVNVGVGFAPMIKIIGAGSASTVIDPSTNCGSGAYGIYASDGIVIGVGSVKITTNCAGGSGLSIQNGAVMFLADNDVNFAGAVDAIIRVGANARFDANYIGPKSFTISSGAAYGFAGSSGAVIITGFGVTNTITNNPTFSIAFISMLDNSFYNEGIGSSWSGSALGTRYNLALGSRMDREQSIQLVPGNAAGTVQGASVYYANGLVGGISIDTPCIGGAGGCRNATAPTGMGTGGTASMFAGSNDHSGSVSLAMGTGPSTSGTVVVAPVSILTGDYGRNGFCVVGLSNLGATWPSGSMVQSWFDSTGIHIAWSATVVASASYNINYVCN